MLVARSTNGFDALAMYAAMDAKRIELGLSWREAADAIWRQSIALNERRKDHPISPSTLTGIAKRGDTTCQHALFILRWLDRSPESFLRMPPRDLAATKLPSAGKNQRLRWNLGALYDAVSERRQQRHLTWAEAAAE